MEDEFVIREKKILSLLEQEVDEGEEMTSAVRHIAEEMLLREKGYAPSDIRKNVAFTVILGSETIPSQVDFLLSLGTVTAMVIKCAAGSLSSRERHVLAAARICSDLPVPIAVVMDPMSAVVLDTATGTVLGEGFDAIPTKQQLGELLAGVKREALSPQKLEREKRVFLAFDVIKCCVPKGADGGVQIGEPDPGEKAQGR